MMTQQLEVSILTAPIAAIDRRTLSQAWYSALGFARSQSDSSGISGFALKRTSSRESATARMVPASADAQHRSAGVAARVAAEGPRKTASAGEPPPRTRVYAHLSRRVRLRFGTKPLPVRRASFSLGRGLARVYVVVQTQGETTRLIAFCRPELRAVVESALAHARIALIARGLGAACVAKNGRGCF